MSGIGGVSHHHHHIEAPSVGDVGAASAPTESASTSGASASSSGNPLQALQKLFSQVETSANTRAIPAHQNW